MQRRTVMLIVIISNQHVTLMFGFLVQINENGI